MEFVSNAKALGSTLIEGHRRWHPDEPSYKELRELMRSKGVSERTRKNNFQNIIKPGGSHYVRPVMNKVLISKLGVASQWYRGRLAYTRSAAVTSMTGYAMGIGDRHLGNILLDSETSELVHIDFGITFEQGRLLPVPEKIPFRLTRDIVDGMGPSGTEGVFRRSCEATLRVLRSNCDPLLTVLEVLLHDPLYRWKKSHDDLVELQQKGALPAADENEDCVLPVNANADRSRGGSIFGDDSVERDRERERERQQEKGAAAAAAAAAARSGKNTDAEVCLLKIKEKLRGLESGQSWSIEGQVKHLLAQAQDPDRLATTYEGWSSWY